MLSTRIETDAAIESLQDWRQQLRARMRQSFAEGAQALLACVRARVSGDVLQARSGALRASLRAETNETAGGFAARVWSDGSVPYARVQEYGGHIAVPEIAVRSAKALAFPYGGKLVFAKRTAAHMVTIPERSYMRSSLAAFAPVFVDNIRKLTAEISP